MSSKIGCFKQADGPEWKEIIQINSSLLLPQDAPCLLKGAAYKV